MYVYCCSAPLLQQLSFSAYMCASSCSGTLLLNMGRYEDASKRFQDAITYRPKLAGTVFIFLCLT